MPEKEVAVSIKGSVNCQGISDMVSSETNVPGNVSMLPVLIVIVFETVSTDGLIAESVLLCVESGLSCAEIVPANNKQQKNKKAVRSKYLKLCHKNKQ